MSVQHEQVMLLPAERHPRLAVAAAPSYPEPTPGWIVMRSYGGYDGGIEPEEPHTVYYTRQRAEEVASETPQLGERNQIIEVSIPYTGPWGG